MTFLASKFPSAEWTMVMMSICELLQMLLLIRNRKLVMLMMVMDSLDGEGRFQCLILHSNKKDTNLHYKVFINCSDFYLVVCWILWNKHTRNKVESRHSVMFLPVNFILLELSYLEKTVHLLQQCLFWKMFQIPNIVECQILNNWNNFLPCSVTCGCGLN